MKHKSILFILPLLLILFWLFLIPYYNLFSFDDWKTSLDINSAPLTEFNISELKEINELLSKIDDTKISDNKLKNYLNRVKSTFEVEEQKIFLENKKIEEEQKILEEEKKRIEEEQRKKQELAYPKEFDITKKLAKLHIQERNLSCEAAATTDILSTILKTDIKESDILDKMIKEKTYWKASYVKDWKIIWWDPDNWFVWEMDGHQFNLTWYAIYEKPMSKIYVDYWVDFDTYNKFENSLGIKNTKEALSYLLKELVKGNYVQIWWDYCTDQKFEDGNIDRKISTSEANSWLSQKNFCYSFNQERRIKWYTEDGKEIDAAKQSHNFVLLGYIWDINNPEKIIIWDTQTWRHIYPTAEWMRKWELNDARAIIVYDKKENKSEDKKNLDKTSEDKNSKEDIEIKDEPKRKEDSEETKN